MNLTEADRKLARMFAGSPPVAFLVDGVRYSVAEMLAANADDPELCEWLHVAQVGDVFQAPLMQCECIEASPARLFHVTGYVPDGEAIDVTREFPSGSDAVAWALEQGAVGVIAHRVQE